MDGMELNLLGDGTGGGVLDSRMVIYLLCALPGLLLSAVAQAWVQRAFKKWSEVPNRSRMTGAAAAAEMLTREGLTVTVSDVDVSGSAAKGNLLDGVTSVRIVPVAGNLSDHYDPQNKVLRLSSGVFRATSVAALGIACHEAGHALQHARGYGALQLRTLMVPVVNIGSRMYLWVIGLGFLLNMTDLVKLGIALFGLIVLFQLVTLPVEFNASARAKEALIRNNITVDPDERGGVATVLRAAALTYVAALVASVGQLLQLLIRCAGNRRR